MKSTRDVWDALSTDDASPDLERTVGSFIVQVWFTPDLAHPSYADVYVVDAANLIPRDMVTVDARAAHDAFRHPSTWSEVVRHDLEVVTS